MCVGECSWGHRTHSPPLRMHMNTQPHLPCTVLWWVCMYMQKRIYIYTECTYGSCMCIWDVCFPADEHIMCTVRASLACCTLHVYLFASLVYVPKTWFLICRHEARMHQSAVSRRAVNLEQSSLLIRWLINAGERARAR